MIPEPQHDCSFQQRVPQASLSVESHGRPWLGAGLRLCRGLSLHGAGVRRPPLCRQGTTLPAQPGHPSPVCLYAEQTKPNVLDRGFYLVNHLENLPTNTFYIFNQTFKLARHAALTGTERSECDMNKSGKATPPPLQMGIWWHSSQAAFTLLLLTEHSAAKAKQYI